VSDSRLRSTDDGAAILASNEHDLSGFGTGVYIVQVYSPLELTEVIVDRWTSTSCHSPRPPLATQAPVVLGAMCDVPDGVSMAVAFTMLQ
jgi:hypothetical protein